MRNVRLPAHYYQQFDADYKLDVPGEGYVGWKRAEIEISLDHTALVVMHAWDTGPPEVFPGWRRAVEYIPRAERICREVFPPLLSAVRQSPMPVFHVTGGGDYYRRRPGYQRTTEIAGPDPEPVEQVEPDEVMERLQDFRAEHVNVGPRNREDVRRGFERVDFPPEAMPLDHECIAKDARQLFALCRHTNVDHLVYIGFAINWCLLMSAGGMVDMKRHGLMCSTIREAVTAVENKETARMELSKGLALWRVAVAFGFVFDLDDFIAALEVAS